jgi:hypothetical protein
MRRRGLLPADATMEGLAAKAAEGQAQFNSESGGGTAEIKAVQEQDEAGFEVHICMNIYYVNYITVALPSSPYCMFLFQAGWHSAECLQLIYRSVIRLYSDTRLPLVCVCRSNSVVMVNRAGVHTYGSCAKWLIILMLYCRYQSHYITNVLHHALL